MDAVLRIVKPGKWLEMSLYGGFAGKQRDRSLKYAVSSWHTKEEREGPGLVEHAGKNPPDACQCGIRDWLFGSK